MDLLLPDWSAPAGVRALMTTRSVEVDALDLPSAPRWLTQVHGTTVVRLGESPLSPRKWGEGQGEGQFPEADASYTTDPGVVCVVKSADCLPVLFCDDAGTVVAAAHAGWRGLAAGVLEATVRALPVKPVALMAWLGAAVGPESFEVGAEVRAAFVAHDPAATACFRPRHPGPGLQNSGAGFSRDPVSSKYLADLYGLARQRLAAAGVTRVSGGGLDTLREPARFFSYRRDGRTGRMAALVWLRR